MLRLTLVYNGSLGPCCNCYIFSINIIYKKLVGCSLASYKPLKNNQKKAVTLENVSVLVDASE